MSQVLLGFLAAEITRIAEIQSAPTNTERVNPLLKAATCSVNSTDGCIRKRVKREHKKTDQQMRLVHVVESVGFFSLCLSVRYTPKAESGHTK